MKRFDRSGPLVRLFLMFVAAPVLGACGSADSGVGAPANGSAKQWKTMIAGDWTQAPGSEGYTCVRQTIIEDIFVTEFESINPLGTHHTLLTMGEPNAPDGTTTCTSRDNFTLSAFGSGVGTNPLAFPQGVALRIKKGTQLLLNLHLFNTGTQDLSGTSGTRVVTVPESEVVHFAEGILAGTNRLDIPPAQTTKHTGFCTMTHDSTLFAVSPHMHQLGTYAKVAAERSAGEVVLFDGPYNFDEQLYHRIAPVELAKGEKVRVECTHHNTTAQRVVFGDSSLAEMCFAGLYRYPADDRPFGCIE